MSLLKGKLLLRSIRLWKAIDRETVVLGENVEQQNEIKLVGHEHPKVNPILTPNDNPKVN